MAHRLIFKFGFEESVLGQADYQFISIFAGSKRIGGGHVACHNAETELYFPSARMEKEERCEGLIIRFSAQKEGDDDAS